MLEKIPIATVLHAEPHGRASPKIAPLPTLQNKGGAQELLAHHRWPPGLRDAFIENVSKTPLRFFICDDSGSMHTDDGKILAGMGAQTKFVRCSRWAELTNALRFHINFARAAMAPTEFRLLNGNGPVRVGFDVDDGPNVELLNEALDQQPTGGTPLCRHIRDIISEIREVEPQLRALQQRACIVIATDGEASDGDVAEALRPLKDLPCWVILRLCTSDDSTVNYWNRIDQMLELNMDVLDDLSGEAKEIRQFNPWLSYAEPLQRMREFGVSLKEFDLLDESRLSMEYLRKMCCLIYGNAVLNLPLPEVDLKGFIEGIDMLNQKEPKVWSPAHRVLRDWVDVRALNYTYGVGVGAVAGYCCAVM